MKLYHFPLSGNAHKVRLMLSMLSLPHEVAVPTGGAHKQPEFLAMNPFGQVPVLVDGEVVVRDSQAILVYLAARYGGPAWWPEDPARLAAVQGWLSTAANEVSHGPALLRMHRKFGRSIDLEATTQRSLALLYLLDDQLRTQPWLVPGDQPSIADLAVYPYIALAPEGGLELSPHVHLMAWLSRMQALPGHVDMPGLWRPIAKE
ncbi:glutathione S-transferase family protein [Mitsuaria sp. WAJ17]|uniref:glutathione S-transferase family protein n=1 Tax=Mitsuaria sp. WAJ17 TaxID=2761452 RepID=UPI0016039DD3|nr:glutathione S-transferase family protein [Mitsuaria sp. WAJ17]MBB2487517.1 glutathione S-transferase family protein [Mitsuaria sp. WAJ17]